MPDERDRHVSRPPAEVLNVLCVDGTDSHDSISFLQLMKWAGRKRGLSVRNLHFCLAPGVADATGPAPYLVFAKNSNTCQTTDFLYLSGHGGMSGNVVGEQPEYMMFFSQLNLARAEFLKMAQAPLVSPLWIILASCFSLRKIHCQLWARYFEKQQIPVRGILGYRRTSPIAKHSVAINDRFASHLSNRKTILESWRLAHDRGGLRDRWTALLFDYSKGDTLESLAQVKKNRTAPTAQEKEKLHFYFGKKTGGMGGPELVKIQPPVALLEMHCWTKAGDWDKFLVTNIDFTQASLTAFIGRNPGTPCVNNASWNQIAGKKKMVDMHPDYWSFYPFFPDAIYQVSLLPPFTQAFSQGYPSDIAIDFTIVHVRRDYSKPVKFTDLFNVLKINDQPAATTNHDIIKGKQSRYEDTIRIKPSAADPFRAAKFVVQFKANKPKGFYLWFWFGITITRAGTKIFEHDFNDFTVIYEQNPHYSMVEAIQAGDPQP